MKLRSQLEHFAQMPIAQSAARVSRSRQAEHAPTAHKEEVMRQRRDVRQISVTRGCFLTSMSDKVMPRV